MSADPDVITDIDVIDPIVEDAMKLAVCGNCGRADHAMDMVHQSYDDDWLCPVCDAENRADYDDYMRTARGW